MLSLFLADCFEEQVAVMRARMRMRQWREKHGRTKLTAVRGRLQQLQH